MRLRRRRSPEDEFPEYYDDDFKDPERDQSPEPRPRQRRSSGRFWIHIVVVLVIITLFLAGIRLLAGGAMFEKTLQAIIAPAGLVWVALSLTLYFCLLRRQATASAITLIAWLLLTAAGNQFVANALIDSLESEYVDTDTETHFDVVLVLGGGTGTTPAGTAQGNAAGDRIIVAADLFHQSRVDTLICSGTSGLPLAKDDLTAAESAVQILKRLGVDETAIVKIDGANTLAEIQAFDRWLNEQPNRNDLTVGVLSSAWHLPRVMRLTDSVGIDASGIPANFLSRKQQRAPDWLIPSEDNLMRTRIAMKEYFAEIVGR